MNSRPFKVLGIQQIAVSGLDKTRLRSLWVDTLGLEPSGTFRSESDQTPSRSLPVLWAAHKKKNPNLSTPSPAYPNLSSLPLLLILQYLNPPIHSLSTESTRDAQRYTHASIPGLMHHRTHTKTQA